MVSVKKSTIFSSVFFIKIGLEIMFSYGLERKKLLVTKKVSIFCKSKKWVFSKGVHPSFGQKIRNFSYCVFQQNRPKNNV